MNTLASRFEAFLSHFAGAEKIDTLLPTSRLSEKKRADFFIAQRHIAIEVKSLQSDPYPKIDQELARHEHRLEFPHFYGSMPLQDILKNFPDQDRINERIFRSVTISVENALIKADRQLRDTFSLFPIDERAGMVVLLNDAVEVLSPTILGDVTVALLKKWDIERKSAQATNFVWILSETHGGVHGDTPFDGVNMLVEAGYIGNYFGFDAAFERLQSAWCDFNAGRMLRSDIEQLTDLAKIIR